MHTRRRIRQRCFISLARRAWCDRSGIGGAPVTGFSFVRNTLPSPTYKRLRSQAPLGGILRGTTRHLSSSMRRVVYEGRNCHPNTGPDFTVKRNFFPIDRDYSSQASRGIPFSYAELNF
ncbi:hypothetical protein BV25DRAFT_1825659 [Artomyces pyxidatus]|uniref:Uncharacterized protein n=1 Tax=Artomyces pyxidatus TaxID=48021 RepID=A0ACB8T2I3_9AGAM|nr:hypothetical protein BV25DRAFT_1825659 [Artomyces pyxidatus]